MTRYLLQAGRGQLALSNEARPIKQVIEDERTPPRIRALLSEIDPIKRFAERNGLKATRNYTDYVKLNRAAAVWVVSASEKLRFKSKEWGFPFFGSFPYLGWFDLDEAKSFAKDLKKDGKWDVNVRGASAYSTLGWFHDAVLSTMIPDGDEALGELVNVVVHESTHATVYVSSQAYFDESMANFVAGELTPVYLKQTRGDGSKELEAYVKAESQGDKRVELLHQAYVKLDALYSSSQPDEAKIEGKKKILDQLKADLGTKYDINNATLIQYRTYNVGQDEFKALLAACGGSWSRFLAAAKTLEKDDKAFSKKNQEEIGPVITKLAREGCAGQPSPSGS